MHENRYLYSLANRCGARRSVEIQSIGYGAVTQQSRVGNWPVQQERSRHRRSPFFFLGSSQLGGGTRAGLCGDF